MIPSLIFMATTAVSLGCFIVTPGWPAASMTIASMIILGSILRSQFADYEVPPPSETKEIEDLKRQLELVIDSQKQMKSQANIAAAFTPRKL